jgi:hypothetical protein
MESHSAHPILLPDQSHHHLPAIDQETFLVVVPRRTELVTVHGFPEALQSTDLADIQAVADHLGPSSRRQEASPDREVPSPYLFHSSQVAVVLAY